MAIKMAPALIIRPNSLWKARVIEMQQGLLDLGYDIGKSGVDGEYGDDTLKAVIKFQSEHSLDADGEFGPQSWTAMYEALGYTVSNPSYPTASTTTNTVEDVASNTVTVLVQKFSEGDQVKVKEGATWIGGKTILPWVFNAILYVKSVNSSDSISVSTYRNGLITGNISPSYLELVSSAEENSNNQTIVTTESSTEAKSVSGARTASALVAIAKAEVGYHEKASNSSLDDASGNSGDANFTKYARDLANAGYYNGDKNGYAWCDVFVDWCFYQLCGNNATEAEDMIYQDGDCGAGCEYSANYYKSAGAFDLQPKVGDQIFFYYSGSINHTGIVIEVTSTTITTVEGNSSDQVAQRNYPVGYATIAGYGHPKYASSSVEVDDNSVEVRVTANKLNIRSAASSTAGVVAIANKGDTYIIVEQQGTYGKLSTGVGWIDLTYTEAV